MDKLIGNSSFKKSLIRRIKKRVDRSKLLSDISEGDKLKGNIKILPIMEFSDLGGLDGLVM